MYSVLNAYAGGGLDRLGQSHLVSLNNNLHTLREDDRNFLVIAIFPELGSRQFSNILTTRQCIGSTLKKTTTKNFPPGSQNGISRPNCDRLQNLLTSNSVRLLQKLSRVPNFVFFAVLWIRIRMDPELLLGSGSGIIVPDPAKYERADK